MHVSTLLTHFEARRGKIDGVSVLGGEPTEQSGPVTELFAGLKVLGLSTVLFSGLTYEALQSELQFTRLLAHTDLLIDGPFLLEEQDLTLHWRGSRNQRLIRLSERFQESELRPPVESGEIFLSSGTVTLHGVGTMALPWAKKYPV